MSRISTHAANTFLFDSTRRLNQRFIDGQLTVSTEKKSQDYKGLNVDARRLVSIENTRSLLEHYKKSNEQEDIRLQISDITINSLRESLKDFNKSLTTFSASPSKGKIDVDEIQAIAFRTLFSVQDYLNTEVDGNHLYAGGKTTTQPVNMSLTNVTDFQTKYDGSRITFPITRDAHLDTYSLSKDVNNQNKKHINTNNFLQFRQDGDNDPATAGISSITASSAIFSNVSAGSYYTVSNTTNNNGNYVVDSVSTDGQTINVKTKMFTDESTVTAATITYADPTDQTKTLTLSHSEFTSLTFDRNTDKMVSAAASGLSALKAGDYFTISGSSQNNGTFTVKSKTDDKTAIIESIKLTDEGLKRTNSGGTATLDLYTNTDVKFTSSSKTIQVRQAGQTTGVADIFSSLVAGNQFTVANSTSNNSTFTVASVSTDGSSVTVTEAVADETDTDGVAISGTVTYTSGSQVTFTNGGGAGSDTIQVKDGAGVALANAFSSLSVGDKVSISGAGAGYDNAYYTVAGKSNTDSTITVSEDITASTTTNTTGTHIQVNSGGTKFFNMTTNTDVEFTASTNKIEIRESGVTTAVSDIFVGLKVGNTFSVAGSASNNGLYTIASIASDGSSITVKDTDINFTASTKTIQIRESGGLTGVPNVFTGLVAGNQFTIASSASNNGTFTVASISADGSSAVVTETVVDETDTNGASISGAVTYNSTITNETDVTGLTLSGTGDVPLSYKSGSQARFTNVGAAGSDTIQILDGAGAALTGTFNDLTVGQTFSLSNAGPGYDHSSYTITAKSTDGSTVTVAEDITGSTATNTSGIKIEAFAVSGSISAASYYKGDALTQNHRISAIRKISDELTAINPAFEKAIRAMGLIIQGKYGTAGGLDQNLDRVTKARYLLNSAEDTVTTERPTGLSKELTDNLQKLQVNLAYNRVLIKDINTLHTKTIGYYQAEVAAIENTDMTEAITRLLDDQRALEASFETYSRVRQLSLINYL